MRLTVTTQHRTPALLSLEPDSSTLGSSQGHGLVGHVRRGDAELFAEGIGKVEMRLSKKGD